MNTTKLGTIPKFEEDVTMQDRAYIYMKASIQVAMV